MSVDVETEDEVTVEEYRAKRARDDMTNERATSEQRTRIEELGCTVGLRIDTARLATVAQAERVIASLTLLRERIRGRRRG